VHWSAVALGYVSYLAIVACVRPAFAKRRGWILAAAALGWLAFLVARAAGWPDDPQATWLAVVPPSLVLIAGYWLSGLFFVGPDARMERWLRDVDETLLVRSGALAWCRVRPAALTEYFEFSYLLVYLLVPAGAATLALAGHGPAVGRYWTTVLLAEFACYGMLPWIQPRPPRLVEAIQPPVAVPGIRRVNLAIVNRASIGVNTVPSGHAAGALAAALAVAATMPVAGAVFLVLAASITMATVIGRYHYLVDSMLGVLVAVIAWWLVP